MGLTLVVARPLHHHQAHTLVPADNAASAARVLDRTGPRGLDVAVPGARVVVVDTDCFPPSAYVPPFLTNHPST